MIDQNYSTGDNRKGILGRNLYRTAKETKARKYLDNSPFSPHTAGAETEKIFMQKTLSQPTHVVAQANSRNSFPISRTMT